MLSSQPNSTADNSVHVKMKVKGKSEKINDFYQILRAIDWDFPLGQGKINKGNCKEYHQCGICRGMKWKNPMMTTGDIEKLGKQVGVVVKVKQFKMGSLCSEVTK